MHHFLGAGVAESFLKILDRSSQALDDGAALIGYALPLQGLAFRLGLGLFDDQYFFSLAARRRGDLFALRRIDVIHRRLDLGVGDNVGHEDVDDFEAERRHVDIEFMLDGGGYARLAGEDFVERHPRHMAQHDLFDIGFDLRLGIGQLVIGFVDFFRPHPRLHRNRNGDEDVVSRLGLHGQRHLVDAQTHASLKLVDEGKFPVQSSLGAP